MRDKLEEGKRPPVSEEPNRAKIVASRLRAMRAKRDGTTTPVTQSRKRRPNEDTASRNQRIIERYEELLCADGRKQWGIMTQLGKEFSLSRQYVSDKVIRPYLKQPR